MFTLFVGMALFVVPFSLYLVIVRGNVSPAVAIAYVAICAVYIPVGVASFLMAL